MLGSQSLEETTVFLVARNMAARVDFEGGVSIAFFELCTKLSFPQTHDGAFNITPHSKYMDSRLQTNEKCGIISKAEDCVDG